MFQLGSQDAKMFYHLATRQASGEPISHGQQDRQPGPDNPERAVLDFFCGLYRTVLDEVCLSRFLWLLL